MKHKAVFVKRIKGGFIMQLTKKIMIYLYIVIVVRLREKRLKPVEQS